MRDNEVTHSNNVKVLSIFHGALHSSCQMAVRRSEDYLAWANCCEHYNVSYHSVQSRTEAEMSIDAGVARRAGQTSSGFQWVVFSVRIAIALRETKVDHYKSHVQSTFAIHCACRFQKKR